MKPLKYNYFTGFTVSTMAYEQIGEMHLYAARRFRRTLTFSDNINNLFPKGNKRERKHTWENAFYLKVLANCRLLENTTATANLHKQNKIHNSKQKAI